MRLATGTTARALLLRGGDLKRDLLIIRFAMDMQVGIFLETPS